MLFRSLTLVKSNEEGLRVNVSYCALSVYWIPTAGWPGHLGGVGQIYIHAICTSIVDSCLELSPNDSKTLATSSDPLENMLRTTGESGVLMCADVFSISWGEMRRNVADAFQYRVLESFSLPEGRKAMTGYQSVPTPCVPLCPPHPPASPRIKDRTASHWAEVKIT